MLCDFRELVILAACIVPAALCFETSEQVVSLNTTMFGLCIFFGVLQIIFSVLAFKRINTWKKWFAVFFAIAVGCSISSVIYHLH